MSLLENTLAHSYEFMSEHKCDWGTEEKVLITLNDKKEPVFIKMENNKPQESNMLLFNQLILDFDLMDTHTNERIKIEGFTSKCDMVKDNEFKIIYFLCYQNIKKFIKEVEVIDEKK